MYCLAKWTERTWGIPTDRWLWRVSLRPQQREAPPNRRGPTPRRPTTLQLCPYVVTARLMALLWPGPHIPNKNYPHLTEEDMPGIQRCFFRTLDYLQQMHPHVLEQILTPPDNPRARTAKTTPPHRHMHLHRHQHAQVTRESERTRPVPDPTCSFSLLAGPNILRPPLAAQGPPPSPTALCSASHSTTSTTTTTSSTTTTTTSSSSTPPPKPRGKPPERAPKPVPTATNPAAAKAHAPTRPAPAARPKPKTAATQPPKTVGAPRPQPAAKPMPKPKPGATTAARARPPKDVLYDIQPEPSQARRQQRPARRPPTNTSATATTSMAERTLAKARRTSSRHLLKPAPQAQGLPPTGPERRHDPPAASPAPYQPSMSAHIQRMPRYRRRCKSTQPRGGDRARTPASPHLRAPPLPAEQDYEESPRPATATSPHDPVTPTHAHSSAQVRGPAQGQWWQR